MTDAPLILFDGVCNLCNASVKLVLAYEDAPRFKFASLQSPAGQALTKKYGITADSIVLVQDGRAYVRSAAALRIAWRMRLPFKLLVLFWIVPWPLRDLVYALIARTRYSVFGKTDACMVPTPELRARFVEDSVPA